MSRPEVIAHRGASRDRPENTLAAFMRAAELRADAVELDVHATADGHLVVHHDPSLPGPLPRRAIGSLTLAELKAYRVRGEPVPTLEEVVEALAAGTIRVYCELKGADTAPGAVAALRVLGARAAVHSFDHRLVMAARSLDPALARGVLETSYHRDPGFPMRDVGARDLWQQDKLIDPGLIAAVHAEGGRVIAWTVNDAGRATELAGWNVDGLCTDDVPLVQAAIGA